MNIHILHCILFTERVISARKWRNIGSAVLEMQNIKWVHLLSREISRIPRHVLNPLSSLFNGPPFCSIIRYP